MYSQVGTNMVLNVGAKFTISPQLWLYELLVVVAMLPHIYYIVHFLIFSHQKSLLLLLLVATIVVKLKIYCD